MGTICYSANLSGNLFSKLVNGQGVFSARIEIKNIFKDKLSLKKICQTMRLL